MAGLVAARTRRHHWLAGWPAHLQLLKLEVRGGRVWQGQQQQDLGRGRWWAGATQAQGGRGRGGVRVRSVASRQRAEGTGGWRGRIAWPPAGESGAWKRARGGRGGGKGRGAWTAPTLWPAHASNSPQWRYAQRHCNVAPLLPGAYSHACTGQPPHPACHARSHARARTRTRGDASLARPALPQGFLGHCPRNLPLAAAASACVCWRPGS